MPRFFAIPTPHPHTPHTQPLLPTYLGLLYFPPTSKVKKKDLSLNKEHFFPEAFWIRTHHPAITRKLRMHIYLSIYMRCPVFQCISSQKRQRVATDFFSIMIAQMNSSCQNVGSTRSCNEGFLLTHILVNKMQKKKKDSIEYSLSLNLSHISRQFGVRNCTLLLTRSVTIQCNQIKYPHGKFKKLHPSLDKFCHNLVSEIAPFS